VLTKPTLGLINFTVPKTDIVHTKSGLILHYLSEYRPANKIITFTVTIPMVPDMCYLIPRVAMRRIPHCRTSAAIMEKRTKEKAIMEKNKVKPSKKPTTTSPLRIKRFLAEIFSIGTGATAIVMSTTNMVQIANLKSEVKTMQDSLLTMNQTIQNNQAQILHFNEGQLKLAHELNYTQVALNKTLAMVNEHSYILRNHEDALRTIMSQTVFLSTRLASFVHAVETHFIHHKDVPKVVEKVSQAINMSVDESNSSISMVELITRLLVRQQIDFVQTKTAESTENGHLIGKLVFSSFFAAPTQDQAPFSIYELVPIPFNQGKRRVRLAQMSAYLGIEPKSQQFIHW